jgi:hypothetical protein
MTTPATPAVRPPVRERWVLLHRRLVRHSAALERELQVLDRLPHGNSGSGPAELAHRAAVAHSLFAADAAVARMRDGTYGTCRHCLEPIPVDQLELNPVAADCVACTRRQANDGWMP